jgi:hypothetical protein
MYDLIPLIEELYDKAGKHLSTYTGYSNRDIRNTFFQNIINQCGTSHINLTINDRYISPGSAGSLALFGNDPARIKNYNYHLEQNTAENIAEAALFQSELVYRALNANINGVTLYDKSTMPQLIAGLFNDTENAWTKDESKLIMLLSAIRNTIHTGGIYSRKTTGETIVYKGNTYTFTHGKASIYPAGFSILHLISELLDAIKVLFDGPIVTKVGALEHPNYYALGK